MNSVQIHMTEKLLNHFMQISRASFYKNTPLQFKMATAAYPSSRYRLLWWKQNNTPSKWEGPLQLKLSSAPYPQTQLHACRFELMPGDGAPHSSPDRQQAPLVVLNAGEGCGEAQPAQERPPSCYCALHFSFSWAMVGSMSRTEEHQLLLMHSLFLCNNPFLWYCTWLCFRGEGMENSGWRDLTATALLEQSPQHHHLFE